MKSTASRGIYGGKMIGSDYTYVKYFFYVENSFFSFLLFYMIKGSFSNEKFISENSQTPEINGHIVLGSFEYFWGSIVKCATVCFSTLITNCGPSKITQFTRAIGHYNILWLNVSMCDSIFMHVDDSLGNLFNLACCFSIIQFFFLFQHGIESSLLHIIEN